MNAEEKNKVVGQVEKLGAERILTIQNDLKVTVHNTSKGLLINIRIVKRGFNDPSPEAVYTQDFDSINDLLEVVEILNNGSDSHSDDLIKMYNEFQHEFGFLPGAPFRVIFYVWPKIGFIPSKSSNAS